MSEGFDILLYGAGTEGTVFIRMVSLKLGFHCHFSVHVGIVVVWLWCIQIPFSSFRPITQEELVVQDCEDCKAQSEELEVEVVVPSTSPEPVLLSAPLVNGQADVDVPLPGELDRQPQFSPCGGRKAAAEVATHPAPDHMVYAWCRGASACNMVDINSSSDTLTLALLCSKSCQVVLGDKNGKTANR